MRQYIRHPSNIPIAYQVGSLVSDSVDHLCDISRGGLRLSTDMSILEGSEIRIEIPIQKPPFLATGVVIWCEPESDHFEIGVQFKDQAMDFRVRMVEQICYIECYRVSVLHEQGRSLTSEEAAKEWIEHYASDFPEC